MSLPTNLLPGTYAIYGIHQSRMGFVLPEGADIAFGTVYQQSPNALNSYSIGASVLFPFRGHNTTALIYGHTQYYIIPESSIILVENAPDIS